jgi:hypothetical protein
MTLLALWGAKTLCTLLISPLAGRNRVSAPHTFQRHELTAD